MGIIQGVAEFLPISSSGHLAIAQNLLNINAEVPAFYDVLLHLGTLGIGTVHFAAVGICCGKRGDFKVARVIQHPNAVRRILKFRHGNAGNLGGNDFPFCGVVVHKDEAFRQQGESDEETIRHAEEILRATLKEKENLLKKQRLQIEQQKKLIGEQDTEIRRLNGVVDEQVLRIAKNGDNIIQLENQVGNLLPKALYSDNVLDSVSCFTTTQIAKELGITAQELNRSLCALHIQYYQSGQYLLYADYAHMGLAKSRTRYSAFLDPKSDGRQEKMGRAYTHTYLVWTERGRKFIHDLAHRYWELIER